MRLVVATLVMLLLAGCTPPNSLPPRQTPQDPAVTAEAAREAIVRLITEQPNLFIGNPDPARLRSLPLTNTSDTTWAFGVFTVSLDEMTYTAMIGEDGPEPYFYEGRLRTQDGEVAADSPKLTRFHKRPTSGN